MTGSLRVAALHAPVTVLGPGRRVGLWVQGCQRHCPGCIAPLMQPASGGTLWPVPLLARQIALHVSELKLDGLTISGGEPLDQSAQLRELVLLLKQEHPGLDTLVYSGFSLLDGPDSAGMAFFGEPRSLHQVTDWIDVLIDGEYQSGQASNLSLRGSRNQRIHRLTSLGRQRYGVDLEEMPRSGMLESFMDTGGIFMAGIPLHDTLPNRDKGDDHGRPYVPTLQKNLQSTHGCLS